MTYQVQFIPAERGFLETVIIWVKVAYRQSNQDDTLALKLVKKVFTSLGAALAFIGKPFYLLFSLALIFILVIANATGYLLRTILAKLVTLPLFIYRRADTKIVKLKKTKVIYPKSRLDKIDRFFSKILFPKIKKTKRRLRKEIILTAKALKKSAKKTQKASFLLIKKTLSFLSGFTKTTKKQIRLIVKKTSAVEPKKIARLVKVKLKLYLHHLISALPSIPLPRIKLLIFLFSMVLFFVSVSTYAFWSIILRDLPSAHQLVTRKQDVSTKIYDRNGTLLYTIFKDQKRTPVPLDRIPAQVRLATIAIEDAEFYQHPGFSVRGIARAIIRIIQRGELTGGSTITQQLVKNALLSPERTLVRKLREVVLAIQTEIHFTKDEILEMYLNEVAYGGTAYGIQEASQVYFDKDVDQLTLGEAALLAGLPKSPTRFSPFGVNPEAAFNRQKEVLHLMRINGFITKEQEEAAEKEHITFAQNVDNIYAPHFVMYVRQKLVDSYGEEVVAKGGLEVMTTLDLRIQEMAEKVVKEEVEKLASLNVGNGAALVLDTQTGEILAMVGSKDYFDIEAEGKVNLTTALRQPGSSIKVINYAYALSNGYTPATILQDSPITFNIVGQPPYTPRNYDDNFRGKLPLRNALAESRNVPAVKVLASYGVNNMIEQGRDMGITTWNDPSNYGLSLTLGGGEIKLIDLAQVYATIANYGARPEITSLLKVTNYENKVLEEKDCQTEQGVPLIAIASATGSALKSIQDTRTHCSREQVLDPRVAYILIDILKDNYARSPAFGSSSLLVIPRHTEVAVKTGTSNDLRDNLTIGFNQKYLVAVWVGNNDNSPMARVASGITGATPIWHKIMSALLATEKNDDWQVPQGLVQLPICTLTESLACEGCFTKMEWFLEENKPEYACNPEYIKYIEELRKKDEEEKIQGDILEEATSIER